MQYWIVYFLILLMAGGGLISLLYYLHKKLPAYPILQNLTLVVLSLFVIFMAAEFYFKVFFAQPDAHGTLAQYNWRERYANKKDYNSLDYRDVEWTDDLVAGKTKVMVVGDSFVFGEGIEYPEDRFSNRLGQMLGQDYVVFNVGRSGTDTKDHINNVLVYPYSPDVLILSYVINDVLGATLARQWINRPGGPPSPLPEMPLLVNNSYAFNFMYTRLNRMLQANQPDLAWEWYLDVYNDPDSWWIHREQLLSLYEGTQSQQIPFIVVVFPSMDNTERSQLVTKRIINVYREKNVPVVDVTELIKDIPVKDRIASPVDSHPSELVNKLVADALYEMFIKEGLLN